MTLTISKKEYDEDFSNWLLEIIKMEIFRSINHRKFKLYEDYLKETNIFNMSEKALDSLNLTNLSYIFVRSIRKIDFKKNYIYKFNDAIKYDNVTLYELFRFINYGNEEIKGYPFIVSVLNKIEKKIEGYKDVYDTIHSI